MESARVQSIYKSREAALRAIDGALNGRPEPHYSSSKLLALQEKEAIQKITEKYQSVKIRDDFHLSTSRDSLPVSAENSDESRPNVEEEEEEEDVEEDEEAELSEQDILQVEVFFRSHKTFVYVCQCLANLYFTTSDGNARTGDWDLARTGIPVLLLDKGETRARTKRMLQIVLAERGSGFVLWRDVIDNLSNYKSEDTTFHTMYLSNDHRRMAGFSFDNEVAASEFLERIEELTSDPLNISLSVPKTKAAKKSVKKKTEKIKLPRKCDISQPCCFQHVTNVDIDDRNKLYSMATLLSRKTSV